MLDESKDISSKEILLLYIRYFSQESFNIREVFFTLFELNKTDATTIFNIVKTFLENNNLLSKVIVH